MLLRHRFWLATASLLAVQLTIGAVTLVAWRGVLNANAQQQALAAWRGVLLDFGTAVREQYVHQAHSFIEGGPSHLDHYDDAVARAEAELARLDALPVVGPGQTHWLVHDWRAFRDAFQDEAIPVLRQPPVDHTEALALHALVEAHSGLVLADLALALKAIDEQYAVEQHRADVAARYALRATATLGVLALLLSIIVTRLLARYTVPPLAAIADVASRLGAGERTARVARPASDEIGAVASALNDMADRVAAAEHRTIASERLAALGELGASVAHELLNPLTVILGSTTDPVVRAEAEHATRIVRGLLGFARPGEEPAGDVDLAAFAQAAADRVAPAADLNNVRVVVTALAAPRVRVSASAVRQVLDNLLRNAVEASPEGSLVEVSVRADGVAVADRGAGLPAAVAARLYEPFVTGRPGGTGLGLAVCQRIVRAQGGTLRHEARDGGGTVATWTWDADHG